MLYIRVLAVAIEEEMCVCVFAGLMVAVSIGVVLGILVGAFMLVAVFVFRQRYNRNFLELFMCLMPLM